MTAPYDWIKDERFGSYCLYIGKGAVSATVLSAFGAVLETERRANATELWSFPGLGSDGNDVIQLGQIGDAVVVYEPNGWTSIDETVIKAIAAPVSVSLFRNVNAVMQFTYAKGGKIIRIFDPVLYRAEGFIEEERALGFAENGDNNDFKSFQLIESLTGIRLGGEWLLDQRRPSYLRK
jgi:hypothetical protein